MSLSDAARDRFAGLVQHVSAEPETVRTTHLEDGVYEVEVRVGERRTQLLVAALVEEDGDALVGAFSFIGPAHPAMYERALRANADLRYGRIAIVQQEGRAMLAVVDEAVLDELADRELFNSLHEIARAADRLEDELFGGDDE